MAGLRRPDMDQTETKSEVIDQVEETKVAEPEVEQKAGTKAPETKAVAKAANKAVAVAGTPSFFKTSEIAAQVVANASSGDLPTITATGGTFKISGDKTNIGAEIKFQAIGYRTKWVCSPNSQVEESKQYYAAVYDDDITIDGKTIDQCVADARAAGYDDAKKSEYLDLFVQITDHQKKDQIDVCGEIMVLQLSFMSMKAWNSFSSGLAIKYGWNEIELASGPPVIKAIAEPASNKGGKDYTKFKFSLA